MPILSSQRVAAELRAEAARQRLSQTELAGRVVEGQQWVSRRLSGTVDLSLDDIGRMCDALRVDPLRLLQAADPWPASTEAEAAGVTR